MTQSVGRRNGSSLVHGEYTVDAGATMTYDKWQYRVHRHSLGGDCPKCGGLFVESSCINCGTEYPSFMPIDTLLLGDAYSYGPKKSQWSGLTTQEREDIIVQARAMREIGCAWDAIASALKINRKALVSMVRYE